MENYDDIFSNSDNGASKYNDVIKEKSEGNNSNEHLSKDEWVKQKNESRNTVFAMIDEAGMGLNDLNNLYDYLNVQSRFDRYSVNNVLLIAKQKPEATRLLEFSQLQNMGLYVNQGEKAISILEPGKQYTKDDGTVAVPYNVKKVFDISQTDSEPEQIDEIHPSLKKTAKALIQTSPVICELGSGLNDNVNALYQSEQKRILIRPGMDGEDIIRLLSYEIAHARCDKGDYKREENTTKAYCISYIICKRVGVVPMAYSFDKKPFENMDIKAVKDNLKYIREESNNITSVIEKALSEKNRDAR